MQRQIAVRSTLHARATTTDPQDQTAQAGLRLGGLAATLIAALVLAACSGSDSKDDAGTPAGAPPGASAPPVVTTTNGACATAPAEFTNTVWPSMEATCVSCHAAGRVAAGSKLVFAVGAPPLQNYNLLREYVASSGDLLLSKSIGQPTHGGAAPYRDANSTEYRNLAALMPALRGACTAPVAQVPPTQATFWSGVSFIDDSTALAKAAVLFAGRNPTAAEKAAAAASPAALRQTIRSYMTGPAFERFLLDIGDTHFLTPGVTVYGNNIGLNATDFPLAADIINNNNPPAGVRNRLQASVRREGVELMRHIVRTDRPWTDIVSANYTMVNGVMAQYLGATVQGSFTNAADDNEWLPATIPSRLGGMREHAGVLSTHAWLTRFPTTPTNRNRHRVSIMARQFLATDINALAVRPIDDGGNFRIAVMENPACAVCHDTLDPMAAGFQNWNEANRFLPNKSGAGKDIALPQSYRAGSYPKDAMNQAYYREGDNWFRDQKAPGFGATPMPGGVTGSNTALQWMGQQIAADSRFAMGAVHFWYEGLFGRAPLKQPVDQTSTQYAAQLAAYKAQLAEFEEIAARFRTGGYKVKDLLADLVLSRWFRADKAAGLNATRAAELADVGSVNMLLPTQLNLKLQGLTGITWADFNNPYAGLALNYGDFDGVTRNTRAKSHTMMQSVTIDRLVATQSCNIAMTDMNKQQANRLLFPNVTLADTPATAAGKTAITANVQHLHKWLWKEDAGPTDPEVLRTVKLFEDVWNDRMNAPARTVACGYNNGNDANYTGRAWAAVVAYMLGDPKFLYE